MFDQTYKRETWDYYEAFELLKPMVSERVRVTYPNGGQRIGTLGLRMIGTSEILTFDGSTCMGELANCWRIEQMQPNGRYAIAVELKS